MLMSVWESDEGETGKTTSFAIGLVRVVGAVLIVTTLVSPSDPGCSSMSRASGHLLAGNRSSVSSTTEPTLIS